jgi:asparagine synthase (glutamine-hydrolysing)
VPLARWLRTDLRDMMCGALLDDRARRRGLLEPEMVRRMVDEHVAGRRDWSPRLWTFLWLELWLREFID